MAKLTGIYEYCGDGAGVAGLPHRVDAAELTPDELAILSAAVENGNYKPAAPIRKGAAQKKEDEEA